MIAVNFQDDIPSIPIDNFKEHYVLVFDLSSMQDASEICNYTELVGAPFRRTLNSTSPLDHVTEFIVLVKECLRLQLTSLVLLEKTSKIDHVSLQ